jgi:Holliday junction resolvasome RuvABC endonuclease subunit
MSDAQILIPLPGEGEASRAGLPEGKTGAGPGPAPRVIGLDLSIAATGIADANGGTIRTATIRTAPAKGTAATRGRLRRIVDEITEVITLGGPSPALVAIEGPSFGSKGNALHQIAGLWWLAVDALMAAGHPVAVIPPGTLKSYATGSGSADKPDMRMALYKRTGIDQRDDNQVDAHWLALAALDQLGHAVVAMPKTQRAALDKVAWPDLARKETI